ncbi:MAG: enoyl-CoA hydratase/isomerase family protein [Ectothiorhodospiraceae bacterium]|nr:enoyl-CoA hydratase/isomerase family protein [Chromatiales bacterium]MCP5154520.1 enoyl-CoA hydratase/isomerase family protein [Ectothiorhodospiraceae bacterium]
MEGVTDRLLVEQANGIGHLVLNQPAKHNAVSLDMWEGIATVVGRFAQDDAVRVIVVSGAGRKAFSAGADISEFEDKRASADAIDHYNAVAIRANEVLAEVDKPTVAMIQGYCVGGGMGLALACDLRIASEDARFAIPAAKLGLAYRWDDVLPLVKQVGPLFAREILYTGRQFSADEALRMGFLNRVVPRAALEPYVAEYAGMIASNAPLTVRAVKLTVAEALKDSGTWDRALVDELVARCYGSEDYAEGRRAFMEKRKPEFKGR